MPTLTADNDHVNTDPEYLAWLDSLPRSEPEPDDFPQPRPGAARGPQRRPPGTTTAPIGDEDVVVATGCVG